MERTIGLLVAAVFVIGCSAPPAEDAVSPSPIPSLLPTSSPTMAPSASPTPAPTASASSGPPPSTLATSELEIRWRAADPVGLDAASIVIDVALVGDAYVLVAELPYREGGIETATWWSADGRTWELAQGFPARQRVLAVTAGGPGFVAAGIDDSGGGGTVLTSVNGRAWQQVSDASLRHAVIFQLVATSRGLVGFGQRSDTVRPAIYTSSDGLAWLAATNESGLSVARGLHAVGAYDGRAVAFVSQGDGKPDAIWETTGRAEWTRTGALRETATVERVAGGPRGWVALGENMAWTSADGRSWGAGVPGPDVTADVIADDAGFVAVGWVGSLPGETCGDHRPFAGYTWTSSDGRIWQKMPIDREFKSAMVTRLLVVDRTLIGFGGRLPGTSGDMGVGRWTARLPDISRPADISDKAIALRSGCG